MSAMEQETPPDSRPCYHMSNPGPRETAPPDVTLSLSRSDLRHVERA